MFRPPGIFLGGNYMLSVAHGPIGPMLLLMERPLLFADATGSRYAALWAESNKLWLRNHKQKKAPNKKLLGA